MVGKQGGISLIRFGWVSVLALLEISRLEDLKRGEKKRKEKKDA
jgi:hypothetical protein